MAKSQNESISKRRIIGIAIALIILYLVLDYFDILSSLGVKTTKFNSEFMGIFINAFVVIGLYIFSFLYIDRKNEIRIKNQESIANALLLQIYEECYRIVKMFDNPKMMNAIVRKVNPDEIITDDNPFRRLEGSPYENETILMDLFKEGILSKAEYNEYFKIKEEYHTFMTTVIVFRDDMDMINSMKKDIKNDIKNTLDQFRVYQQLEIDQFAKIFYSNKEQERGDLGKLTSALKPAKDRFEALEQERQGIFKSTLARFNRIYAFITQVCRLFDKDIHKFSVYAKMLYAYLPKGEPGERINIDDKVLLEYYRLEKDFEGSIELEPTDEGYIPISGEAGHREPKKDPLTVIIDKINDKYGTQFTEMDKVLVQMENDYAAQDKWQSYAQNNDRKTFMLLFKKDFPNVAAKRYEMNEEFFVKMFSDPEMMSMVMDSVGGVLYERLKKKTVYTMPERTLSMVAESPVEYGKG